MAGVARRVGYNMATGVPEKLPSQRGNYKKMLLRCDLQGTSERLRDYWAEGVITKLDLVYFLGFYPVHK